jgi:hypothetical protein
LTAARHLRFLRLSDLQTWFCGFSGYEFFEQYPHTSGFQVREHTPRTFIATLKIHPVRKKFGWLWW